MQAQKLATLICLSISEVSYVCFIYTYIHSCIGLVHMYWAYLYLIDVGDLDAV